VDGKMTSKSAVAIVGGGIVGLATGYALRRRGVEVAVFDPTPGMGQSAGTSRIFRHQHEDASLIPLAREARETWDQWGDELGTQLLGANGTLLAATRDVLEQRANQLESAGLDYLFADRARQCAALPQLRPPTEIALLDQRGGVIYAAQAIAALCGALRGNIQSEHVEGCYEQAGEAVLLTGSGEHRFPQAIIAAGTGTPALAGEIGLTVSTKVEWHARISYPIAAGVAIVPACWQDRSGVYGESVYGTPVPDEGAFAIGLTSEGDDLAITPEGLIENPRDLKQIVDRTTEYVRQAFPGLQADPCAYRLCPSTSLPGGADDLRVWTRGPFRCVGGGNLFKVAPALADRLADAIVGGRLPDRLLPPCPNAV
jgi:sarcosine oxidase